MPKGSPELTEARKTEIMEACKKLYETMTFKEVNLKEIGKVTSPEYIRLEELIQTLNNTEERIIFAMSTISNTPRVDNYVGIERYYKCTKEGEWLFIPVENSSFLSLEENSIQGGYTILDYISIIAKKHGISVMKDIEEKRLQNIFGEQCSVLKIGFMTE